MGWISTELFRFRNKSQRDVAIRQKCAKASRMKDPLLAVAVFLLGASAGALVTMLRYRQEIAHLKAMLSELLSKPDSGDSEAA